MFRQVPIPKYYRTSHILYLSGMTWFKSYLGNSKIQIHGDKIIYNSYNFKDDSIIYWKYFVFIYFEIETTTIAEMISQMCLKKRLIRNKQNWTILMGTDSLDSCSMDCNPWRLSYQNMWTSINLPSKLRITTHLNLSPPWGIAVLLVIHDVP